MSNTNDNQPTNSLASFSDETLFEEIAARLKAHYKSEHGVDFTHGCFEFMFHRGRFQGVEDRPKYRRYISPGKLTLFPHSDND